MTTAIEYSDDLQKLLRQQKNEKKLITVKASGNRRFFAAIIKEEVFKRDV